MSRTFHVVLSLFVVSLLTLAQGSDPTLEKGLGLLQEARTTLDEKALTEASNYFTQLTQKDNNNSAYFYYLARVNAYRTDFYDNRRDKKNAERVLEEALLSNMQSLLMTTLRNFTVCCPTFTAERLVSAVCSQVCGMAPK